MNIRVRDYKDVLILSVSGRLDTMTAGEFTQVIDQHFAAEYTRLVVDLKKVTYLTSAGIKALLVAATEARSRGGDLRLANARAQIRHTLTIAGVDTIIKLYPNVVGATASFFPGPIVAEDLS